jgi:hypothetical protein
MRYAIDANAGAVAEIQKTTPMSLDETKIEGDRWRSRADELILRERKFTWQSVSIMEAVVRIKVIIYTELTMPYHCV